MGNGAGGYTGGNGFPGCLYARIMVIRVLFRSGHWRGVIEDLRENQQRVVGVGM